jgi:hypothetical protein
LILPYCEIDFPLQEAKSLDGIISYLTHEHDGPVHDKGIVTVTSKSVWQDEPFFAVRNVVDLSSDACFSSDYSAGEWICWDFHEKRVRLTHYTIRSEDLKSWVIEISLNGEKWTEIDRRPNTVANFTAFPVARSIECRFIRFTQTGAADDVSAILYIYAFEFFGTLRE